MQFQTVAALLSPVGFVIKNGPGRRSRKPDRYRSVTYETLANPLFPTCTAVGRADTGLAHGRTAATFGVT